MGRVTLPHIQTTINTQLCVTHMIAQTDNTFNLEGGGGKHKCQDRVRHTSNSNGKVNIAAHTNNNQYNTVCNTHDRTDGHIQS